MPVIPVVLVVLIALGAWTATPAQQQPPAETFRSGREVLTIDTSVHDASGRPLTDLQPADFTVRIDGEPRRVLTARSFGTNADARSAAKADAPIAHFVRNADMPPGRVVVFAIDRESIRAGAEQVLLETASKLLNGLSPSDAAAAVGLPGSGIDLTRDHAAVAKVIRTMTGVQPASAWQHALSWEEALAFERQDAQTIAAVMQRECPKVGRQGSFELPNDCPPAVTRMAGEMLQIGRAHAETILVNLNRLLDNLAPLSAPKHLVVLSGGIPFDVTLMGRYQTLADKAARSHVALFVVHLDQPEFDASDRGHFAQAIGGREYASGLGTVAAMTGGQFFMGVGRAAGVFERIASDINNFYELGVESKPSDADGKSHKVQITVAREKVTVRAPSETAVVSTGRRSATDALKHALTEPTDVTELPLEVAAYMTHSTDPEKVRVIVAAAVPTESGITPSQWGAAIMSDGKVIGAVGSPVTAAAGQPWATTGTIDVEPGRYRMRTVIADASGRIGTLELPLTVGMRAAGAVQTSDVLVGTNADGKLQPRARVGQGEPAVGMIELSSGAPLTDTTGYLLLVKAGATEPALRRPLLLRTRSDDKTIVVAEAKLDLSSVPPGSYAASAVLERAGTPFARVSRTFEVVAGAVTSTTAAPAGAAATPPSTSDAAGAFALGDVMQRVGAYVAGYGQQASVIVGVEHYDQRLLSVTGSEVSKRESTAEFALVKTSDNLGWAGFRDVIEVDGRRIGNRQDRLQTLFRSSTPDAGEARKIADESARFNLGPLRRNFNEPTAALFFMSPPLLPRFAFTRKGESTVNGVTVWEVEFKEKTRPTLIRTVKGGDVPSSGTIWVVPSDGTVVRTRLVISGAGRTGSNIDVTYVHDDRLGLWLPGTMKERNESDIVEAGRSAFGATAASARTSVVLGTATYSDFKRFETTATFKIK